LVFPLKIFKNWKMAIEIVDLPIKNIKTLENGHRNSGFTLL
jgi:hypothetical protein